MSTEEALQSACRAAYTALVVHAPGTAAEQMLKDALAQSGYDVNCRETRAAIAAHKGMKTMLDHGFEDGLKGTRYFCPSQGNPVAERDYAMGWLGGETARGFVRTKAGEKRLSPEDLALLEDALGRAESFMSGFEDDETQDGINEHLAALRHAQAALGDLPEAAWGV